MKWETIVGLEAHAELSTRTKVFCACEAAYGGEPNTRVCPVCLGLPGALPALNRAVVDSALRVALALGARVADVSWFERKSYFYPDLPKGYQITQAQAPICRGGGLKIFIPSIGWKTVRARAVLIEEDSGKLIHDGARSLADFNRSGVPLLEIVTEPDMRGGAEAAAFLEALRETLLYLGVSDCKMHEGSLRADVNVSVRRAGSDADAQPGARVEIKNLNSFRAVARAVEAEAARQIAALESGADVARETRRWDDEAQVSIPMRAKETADGYRYFREPDLPPVVVDERWLAGIRDAMPELAWQKRERYARDLGLPVRHRSTLTRQKNVSDLFEAVAARSDPIGAAWVSDEILNIARNARIPREDLTFHEGDRAGSGRHSLDVRKLAALASLKTEGRISREAFKLAAEAILERDAEPVAFIAKKRLAKLPDAAAAAMAAAAVRKVLAKYPEAADECRAGKTKAFEFLMGRVMRKLGAAVDPGMARKALEDGLRDLAGSPAG